jgi:RimJ/RimL family protein N-acetyltransferase
MASAPVIRGSRLLLRPFRPEDVTEVYLGWLNDPERMKFSRHRHRLHDRTSSLEHLRGFESTPHYFWAVEDVSSGDLAGTMTAYVRADAVDVGILIGRTGEGRGHEAWTMALDQLLRVEERPRVTGGTRADHAAMRRIFESAGMAPEMDAAPRGREEGEPATVRYGISREHWLRRSSPGQAAANGPADAHR